MTMRALLAGGALAMSTLFLAGEVSAETTLRYAEFGPNRGTRAEALNWFADELKTRSNGQLQIEFHWGKSLLGTKAVLQGVGDGVADMGSIVGFLTPKKLRAYNLGDLPVDNSDEWVGMRALYELASSHAALQKEFADQNVQYVSNYTTGPIQLICTKPVESLGELTGVKLRGSGPYSKTFADFGANVQRMAQSEVYQALESGLIECNQNYYYSMNAYKQYEVAPHVVELDWGQNMAFGIVMNDASWKSLDSDQQAMMTELGSDFIDHMAKLMIDGRAENKNAMVDGIDGKSITVTRLTDTDRQALIDGGSKYVNAWAEEATEQGYDGADLLESYLALVQTYAAEKDSKGYPWSR